jgi:aminoglycoside/choline kinase family phosphotransferase
MHTTAWEIVAPWMKAHIGPEMMRVGERLCTDLQGLIDRNGQGQRTLCHGDFRADNLMFTGDPGDPGLTVLDWQILVQAPGAFDIGYLMSASVTPDVRRSQEMDLLAGYHAQLVAGGVGGYGFDECLEDYRRALLIGFTYAVQAGGFSNMEHDRNAALIHAMATRCEAACLDLGLASMLN